MHRAPLITIQIPTYNQKQYIKQALDAALFQNYENLQVIVADDCSTDYDIFQYLVEYKNNPKVLIHRNLKNLGRVSNYRSILYNLVEGEWFMNLDGDDSFQKKQFLYEALKHITHKNDDYKIVCFEFNHKLDVIKKHIKWYHELDEETIIVKGVDYIILQKHYQNFMHANTIFNVDAAKKTNFYNQNILTSDFFSTLKIYTQGHVILSSKKIFKWNIHGENASHFMTVDDIKKEKLAIIDFVKYAEEKLDTKELCGIKEVLEFFLYKKVFGIYKDKKKDLHFYKYILLNFKMNKLYIKNLLYAFLP